MPTSITDGLIQGVNEANHLWTEHFNRNGVALLFEWPGLDSTYNVRISAVTVLPQAKITEQNESNTHFQVSYNTLYEINILFSTSLCGSERLVTFLNERYYFSKSKSDSILIFLSEPFMHMSVTLL